jgi:hypothetical protein
MTVVSIVFAILLRPGRRCGQPAPYAGPGRHRQLDRSQIRADLVVRGQRLFLGCEGRIQSEDFARLRRRLAALESVQEPKIAAGEAENRF